MLAIFKHNKDLFLVYTILLRLYIGPLLKYPGALRCMMFWCANNFVNRVGSHIHSADEAKSFPSIPQEGYQDKLISSYQILKIYLDWDDL